MTTVTNIHISALKLAQKLVSVGCIVSDIAGQYIWCSQCSQSSQCRTKQITISDN